MTHANQLFIGIDGGGTGCRALVCDRSGKQLGIGEAGPANIMTDYERCKTSVMEASRKAIQNAGIENHQLSSIPAFLGLAGANIGDAAVRLKSELPFSNSIIETDAFVSLEGAIGLAEGVVAIIGTGSVFAYRSNGVVRTVGGWGFTIGDLGSGAWAGRKLLQEALLAFDGIHQGSPLTKMVLDEFKNNPKTIVEYANTARPGEFGKYAPLVFEFDNKRDPIARRIVRRAVSNIEETLDVILTNDAPRFCMIGGLGPVYANLLSSYYRNRITPPDGNAVTGAANLSIRHFAKGKAS